MSYTIKIGIRSHLTEPLNFKSEETATATSGQQENNTQEINQAMLDTGFTEIKAGNKGAYTATFGQEFNGLTTKKTKSPTTLNTLK